MIEREFARIRAAWNCPDATWLLRNLAYRAMFFAGRSR